MLLFFAFPMSIYFEMPFEEYTARSRSILVMEDRYLSWKIEKHCMQETLAHEPISAEGQVRVISLLINLSSGLSVSVT